MRRSVPCLCLALLLAACPEPTETPVPDAGPPEDAGPADAGAPDAGPVATLPEGADLERMAGLIEALSHPDMGGRLTGTPSGDRAELWLTDTLAETGLEIVTQDVTFPLYEVQGPARLEVLGESGEVEDALPYFTAFREIDFAGSGVVEGEVVFAGYGLELEGRDDYAGLDVDGKIVAVLTGLPPGVDLDPREHGRVDQKLDLAHRHGAVGLVAVLAGDNAERAAHNGLATELHAKGPEGLDPALYHDDLPAVFVHLEATERLLGRSAEDLAADPTPVATGRRVALELNGVTHPEATCRNVLAVHEGTDAELKHEVVILGAHYDHLGAGADGTVFPGAADNASGTGVVLEAALALSGSGVPPKRTMVYAFWCAEEQGLHGSIHYAYDAPLYPLADTAMMLQVDFLGNRRGPYLLNVDDRPLVQTFLGEETGILTPPASGTCASDDCPFLWQGVPAYRFLTYGDYHHVPEDTFENLWFEGIQRVADRIVRGLGRVAY